MTALSAAYEASRKDGLVVDVPVKASQQIWKGGLIVDAGTGYAQAGDDGASYVFLGVAVESILGTTDGAKTVRINKTGSYKYTLAGGASQTNLGARVYISDDQTVGTSSTNSIACGYIVEVIDSTYVRVRIDADVK